VFKSLKQKVGEMKGMTSGFGGLGGLIALSKGKVPPQMLQQANSGALPTGITPEQIAKIQQANPDTSAAAEAKAAADKAAALKKKAEDEASALKKKAEDEAAKAAEEVAAAKEAAKAATEKTAKENAAKALAAATAATEAKKAAAEKLAAAKATAKLAGEEAAKVAKDKAAAADAAAAKKKAEEEAAQAATPRKPSALEALRNRKGNIGKLSPEGQRESGLLTTPGLGRGRTKPGRGRVGSTRRVGY